MILEQSTLCSNGSMSVINTSLKLKSWALSFPRFCISNRNSCVTETLHSLYIPLLRNLAISKYFLVIATGFCRNTTKWLYYLLLCPRVVEPKKSGKLNKKCDNCTSWNLLNNLIANILPYLNKILTNKRLVFVIIMYKTLDAF